MKLINKINYALFQGTKRSAQYLWCDIIYIVYSMISSLLDCICDVQIKSFFNGILRVKLAVIEIPFTFYIRFVNDSSWISFFFFYIWDYCTI